MKHKFRPDNFNKWLNTVDRSTLDNFFTVDDSAMYAYWMLNVQKPSEQTERPHRFETLRQWEQDKESRNVELMKWFKLGFVKAFLLIGPIVAYVVYLLNGGIVESVYPVLAIIVHLVLFEKLWTTLLSMVEALKK